MHAEHGDYGQGERRWFKRLELPDRGSGSRPAKVAVTLPMHKTRGLVVEIRDPRAVRLGAAIMTVLHYGGLRVGAAAPSGHSDDTAYGCWAGTRKKKATLNIGVSRFPATDAYTGDAGYALAPHAVRSLTTCWPGRGTAYGVALYTQELAGFCG